MTAPPHIARLLLRCTLDPDIAELVMGDLHEEFVERAGTEGRRPAARWYWKQALSSSARGRRPLPGSRRRRRSPRKKGAPLADTILQDLRQTLRALAKEPGFAAVAILTLALGIGATTGVFSFADWTMLRPVPGVVGQERLGIANLGIVLEGGGLRVSRLSYPNFDDFAGRLTQIDGLAGMQSSTVNAAAGAEGAVSLPVNYVTASYGDVLGLQPQLGRWFSRQEDDPATPAWVAVIGAGVWRDLYGADPYVIGRDLLVNGRPFEIVGVAADGFEGAELGRGVGAWLPGAAYPWANHYENSMDYSERGSGGYYEFVARLGEGAAWQQAQDELTAAARWLAERYPEDNAKFAPEDGSAAVTFQLYPGIGTNPGTRPYVASTLRLMFAVACLVLVIACANVANLLLVRGMRRSGEVALRKSLGAGRLRLVRRELTEAVVLWVVGGLAGVGVALALTGWFSGAQVSAASPVTAVPLNARMLAFALGLSLLTGLAFSLLPAWMSARVDAARTLQAGSDGKRARKGGLRLLFGAAQLAASLTLLVGATLFARTMANLARVDPGIDPSNLTVTALYPTNIGYSLEGAIDYFDRLRDALDADPASSAVAVSTNVPFYGFKSYGRARVAGATDQDFLEPLYQNVTENYFEMLAIPLTRGRTFTRDEVFAGREVMIVNETMAAMLFGDADPIGRSIEVPQYRADPTYYEVVGVAGDTRFRDLTEEPEPNYYLPLGRGGEVTRSIVMVQTRPGVNGPELLRTTIAKLDPALAPGRIETLEQSVRNAAAQSRMLASLMAALATVAALLSCVGLYAMVSNATAQRTFELGIRIALGSGPGRILRLVLASTASVVGLGVTVGLFGAWSLGRVIESRLYGVERLDPASWTLAVLMLVGVAVAAALVPARRASRLDPVVTLRSR